MSGRHEISLKPPNSLNALSVAGRIRAYWKQLGLDVKIEVLSDGSIHSGMIGSRPVRRVERL